MRRPHLSKQKISQAKLLLTCLITCLCAVMVLGTVGTQSVFGATSFIDVTDGHGGNGGNGGGGGGGKNNNGVGWGSFNGAPGEPGGNGGGGIGGRGGNNEDDSGESNGSGGGVGGTNNNTNRGTDGGGGSGGSTSAGDAGGSGGSGTTVTDINLTINTNEDYSYFRLQGGNGGNGGAGGGGGGAGSVGAGGDGGNGGNGGNGQSLTYTYNGILTIEGNMTLIGGGGGVGGNGGQGGRNHTGNNGGSGAHGGRGGNGGAGGNGGDVSVRVSELIVNGDTKIIGGTSGSGGNGYSPQSVNRETNGAGGTKGNAGKATLIVTGDFTSGGEILVEGHSVEGVAKLQVDGILTTKGLTGDRRDGAIVIDINQLDVIDGQKTRLTSIGAPTSAIQDFVITNAYLANGGELIIDDKNTNTFLSSGLKDIGSMEITNLNVLSYGTGISYLETKQRERQSITTLYVEENATLSFILPEGYYDGPPGPPPFNSYLTQLVTVGELDIEPNTSFIIDTRPDAPNAGGKLPHLGPGDEQWLLHVNDSIPPDVWDNLNSSTVTESSHRLDIYDGSKYPGRGIGDDYDFWARVSVTPMVSLANARLGSLAFVNWGGDLVGDAAKQMTAESPRFRECECKILRPYRCKCKKLNPFFVSSGGSFEYNTGGDLSLNGGTGMAGVSWNHLFGSERHLLTIGLFGEGGYGKYKVADRYQWMTEHSAYGRGDTNYYGGGLLARFGVNPNPYRGLFFEGSFRTGKIDADYWTDTLMIDHCVTEVDFGGTYYGAHTGIGYGWRLGKLTTLETSAKVLWTHISGEDKEIRFAQTHQMVFDAMDSLRTKVGCRLYHTLHSQLIPYLGAAWEYEIDGDMNSHYTTQISGETFDLSRSLEGNSVSGVAGFTLRPFEKVRIILDAGVQGYLGTRQGGAGVLQAKWDF